MLGVRSRFNTAAGLSHLHVSLKGGNEPLIMTVSMKPHLMNHFRYIILYIEAVVSHTTRVKTCNRPRRQLVLRHVEPQKQMSAPPIRGESSRAKFAIESVVFESDLPKGSSHAGSRLIFLVHIQNQNQRDPLGDFLRSHFNRVSFSLRARTQYHCCPDAHVRCITIYPAGTTEITLGCKLSLQGCKS